MHRLILVGLAVAPLAACVTTGKYREQLEIAQTAQKQANDAQVQLDQEKKANVQQKADLDTANQKLQADKQTQDDLNTRLKADDEQISTLQKENKDLTTSTEAAKHKEPAKHEHEHSKKKKS